MRKIQEVLRLRLEAGLSARQVAASLQMARSSVKDYERRLDAAGLGWPLPAELSDVELERRLFPPPPALPRAARAVPDWSVLHQELRRPGVTLMLLWEEYKADHPEGFQYSCADPITTTDVPEPPIGEPVMLYHPTLEKLQHLRLPREFP